MAQAPRPSLETALSPFGCWLCPESLRKRHPDGKCPVCRGEGIPWAPSFSELLLRLMEPSQQSMGEALTVLGASLGAQTVKNPPAMQETWVQSLSWEDPVEEGMATHSPILAWSIPMVRGPPPQSMGSQELDTTE